MQIWDLWFPNAAAQGLSFARARIEPAGVVLVHAAPKTLRVEVRDDDGTRIAFADHLQRTTKYFPMTRLHLGAGGSAGTGSVTREDGWPQAEDIGRVVLLPGGEAGILQTWWNADDGSEWRWVLEFYNRRGT